MVDLLGVAATDNRTGPLRNLFTDFSLGFMIINDRGFVEFLNEEAARIIGFNNADEAHGYSLQDIDSVINCDLMEAFDSVLIGNAFQKQEHRCTNRQGHFIVLSLYCSPFRECDGRVVGLLGIIQDVTSLYGKKAELEEAFCELSIMSQVAKALSSTADLETVLQIILTGVTANQGLGFNRAFLFLIDDNRTFLQGKIAVGPNNPEEAGKIWSHLAQQPKLLIELLNDYVERENSSSFSLSSMISGWEIPLNGSSVFSRAMSEAQWVNVDIHENLDEETRGILEHLKTNHLAVAPIISKEKTLGLIAADNQITGKRITDSDLQLLQAFADNTAVAIERSQLYRNLLEHSVELEEKNKLLARSQEQMVRVEKMSVIGELTSSIAHELRNPLAVIGGFSNLMLTTGKNDSNSEYLNIILTEAKRAESVLHQVLDFSRASRTKSREIDFSLLVRQTYELLISRLKHYQKPPSLDISEEKLLVWGNPDQLQHALYQFMNLSVEDMTDECKVLISLPSKDDMVRLIIEFDGNKITQSRVAKTLNQIFNNPGGTYKLSVIVAGETIRYHGGDFGVESSGDFLPKIYIELPHNRGDKDDQDISC
jgi:PAS domain S-box-containing protein